MQFPLCPGQRAQSVTDEGIQACGQEYCKCWVKQSNKLKDQLYRDPGYGGNIPMVTSMLGSQAEPMRLLLFTLKPRLLRQLRTTFHQDRALKSMD